MKKTNAAKVLPVSLLRQVQCYVQGETLYIPALKEQRKAWGERSGIRRQLADSGINKLSLIIARERRLNSCPKPISYL